MTKPPEIQEHFNREIASKRTRDMLNDTRLQRGLAQFIAEAADAYRRDIHLLHVFGQDRIDHFGLSDMRVDEANVTGDFLRSQFEMLTATFWLVALCRESQQAVGKSMLTTISFCMQHEVRTQIALTKHIIELTKGAKDADS